MKLIHSYHQGFSGGVGDFLKGSVYLHKLCKKHNIPMLIDWSLHPINKYISGSSKCKYNKNYILDIEELSFKSRNDSKTIIDNIFDQIKTTNDTNVNVVVSSFYLDIDINQNTIAQILNYPIVYDTKKLLQDHLIVSEDIKKLHQKILKDKTYSVIQFRLGDNHTLPEIAQQELPNYIKDNYNLKSFNHDYDYLYYLIQKQIRFNNYSNIVILSDSNDFKEYVKNQKNKKIVVTHYNSRHCQPTPGLLKFSHYINTPSAKNIKHTALDVYTLINSKKNISYSAYGWGSGFSIWPSKVFDIPCEAYQISYPAN